MSDQTTNLVPDRRPGHDFRQAERLAIADLVAQRRSAEQRPIIAARRAAWRAANGVSTPVLDD
jgi:hypothetical protein